MAEYEPRNRKGTDNTSAPSIKNYYIRLNNLCLTISIVAIAIACIAYLKHIDIAMFFSFGMMLVSLLFQFALNPIEDEDEED